jgi:hypothetical protein
MNTTNTDYSKRIEILNDLWTNYSEEEKFEYMFEMYDVGFPLAHILFNGMVESTPLAKECIDTTFDALLKAFYVEDTGFDNLEEILVLEKP